MFNLGYMICIPRASMLASRRIRALLDMLATEVNTNRSCEGTAYIGSEAVITEAFHIHDL